MVQVIPALEPVLDRYDGFIIDLWGVLHDGLSPFPWARNTLLSLKAAGKRVGLLSNAPRPAAVVAAKMRDLGFAESDWDFLMTSGQDAWEHLRNRPDPWYQALGAKHYLIGLPKDEGLLVDLPGLRVFDVSDADYLINAGIDFGQTLDSVRPLLEDALGRDLPMVCANPDHWIVSDGRPEVCAGLLATFYENQGGTVRYHGKPFPGVYATCLAHLDGIERARVLAIGDGLKTDIKGANGAGIDSVLITSGVHGEALKLESDGWFDEAALSHLMTQEQAQPTYVLHRLQ